MRGMTASISSGGRNHAGGVPGVDAGGLDVFHHAADEHVVLVGDGVDVQFDGVGEELVHEDGLVRTDADGLLDVGLQVVVVVDDVHRAAAEHVARAHEDG